MPRPITTPPRRTAPKAARPHILYLGDWVFHTGPTFIESPFYKEIKDADLHFYGQRLADALAPKAQLTCLANWQLYRLRPGEFEKLMRKSAAMIVSDVEAKCFHLYPSFFDRSLRTGQVETYPDRLKAMRAWIKGGGGLMMLGGWLSFSGSKGGGGWRRTPMAEALPVECLEGEDLVDSSEGFTAQVLDDDHPVTRGMDWSTFPPIFGYNELRPRDDARVLVRLRETGHPLVVAGDHGKGRVLIYASDPAPHWGINFELWEHYDRFWQQAFAWVRKGKR